MFVKYYLSYDIYKCNKRTRKSNDIFEKMVKMNIY